MATYSIDAAAIKATLAGLAVLLSACGDPTARYVPQPRSTELDAAVSTGRLAMSPDVASLGGRALEEEAKSIAAAWRGVGAGPMHVVIATNDEASAERQMRNLERALIMAGVPSGEIVLTPVATEPQGITVSFEQVQVVLPDCPDVPQGTAALGCTMDRYIGRMVARPADLLGNDRLAVRDAEPSARPVSAQRVLQPLPQRPSILQSTTGEE